MMYSIVPCTLALVTLCLLAPVITKEIIYITVSPKDRCACNEEAVVFNCTAVVDRPSANADGGTVQLVVFQRWEIVTASGETLVDSAPGATVPNGYDFSLDENSRPIGLKVLSPFSGLHLARFTCIGYSLSDSSTASAPAVTLEVAGAEEFSCSVQCPSVYTSKNNYCNISWAAPVAASCNTLTHFKVAYTGEDSSQTDNFVTLFNVTGVLQPFQNYTASVATFGMCGCGYQCNYTFMTPREEAPAEFSIGLQLTVWDTATIIPILAIESRQRGNYYSVLVRDLNGVEVLSLPPYLGYSSSLSLNISSLPQCMSYTVSVTASNTGGNTTAEAELNLDPLASLEVSCVAGEDGCYLEASCVPSQPGLLSGCRLDYSSSGGSSPAIRTGVQLIGMYSSRVTVVPCDSQINYIGAAINSMLSTLGCPRSGMITCPPLSGCSALSLSNGTVQYDAASSGITSGTVATYSCADGYVLAGEEKRTCLVDGTWTGAAPQCIRPCQQRCHDSSTNSTTTVWFPISMTLMIYSVLATAGVAASMLALCRKSFSKGGHKDVSSGSTQEAVALKENLCYGPVTSPPPPVSSDSTQEAIALQENLCYDPLTPPPAASPPATAAAAAAETTMEYEEIGTSSPRSLQTRQQQQQQQQQS